MCLCNKCMIIKFLSVRHTAWFFVCFRRKKVLQLAKQTCFNISLPDAADLSDGISYRDVVARLWHITRCGTIPSKLWSCYVCDKQSCDTDCILNWKFTFVLDFGCKTSWTKYLDDQTDRMVLKTHPTLVACPKLPDSVLTDTRRLRPIVPECLFCRENEFPPRDQNFDDLIGS